MLQKTTAWHIIRRSILVICAVFCLTAFFACSDEQSAALELSDVFATDVSVAYDGRPHSISIANTLDTDTVMFSLNNDTFSYSCPTFSEVGTYTVYFKVVRAGYAELVSSAKVTISSIILSGISAADISLVYDGQPHYITVIGTTDADEISYSTDGVSFSQAAPSFTEPGEYTVYYRVNRPYGEYRSSCSVTIFPDIYGRYFNPLFGVVVVDENSSEIYSVSDGALTYNNMSFTRLSDSDCVYKLTAADNTRYFCAEQSGKLTVSFSDGNAQIENDETVILSVADFNYCESGTITDYSDPRFEQSFARSGDITEVAVALSVREVNPFTPDRLYFTYDGFSHTFDFSEPMLFLDEDGNALSQPPSFSDVGKHTATAVLLSDTFLPRLVQLCMVILPDISGVYISSAHAMQIASETVVFDGAGGGNLTARDDGWAYDGLPITVTDNGLVYNGEAYTETTDTVLVVRVNGEVRSAVAISNNADQMIGEYDGDNLILTADDATILGIPFSGDGISVTVDGAPLAVRSQNGTYRFILGLADISAPVVVLEIITE